MRLSSCLRMPALFFAVNLIVMGQAAMAEAVPSNSSARCEQEVSFDLFRAIAFNKSPLLAEIDKEFAMELAKAFDIETLPNPELQLERTFTRMSIQGANDPQAQISLGQPLRLSNFGARARVADLLTKAGDRQKRLKILEFTQKLAVQYQTLRAFEETAALLKDAEANTTRKVKLIHEGVKKGLLSQGDERLFEGEQYRLQAQGKSVASTVAMLQGDISRSVGYPCLIKTAPVDGNREIPRLEVLLEKAKANELSEASRVDLLTKLTEEQVRLAELDTLPAITPRFLYQHTNDSGDFYGVGFSIPLPLWNQNQGEKMRAAGEARVAQVKARFIKDGGFESQIENLRNAAVHSGEQAQIFAAKVVPAFKDALGYQERIYAEGKGNVLQVWQTLRTHNEVRTQSLQLALQAAIARVELSILVGEEI